MLKIDLKLINKAVEDKWITKRDHPSLPISIYTYSKRTEIDNNWNDITKMCRGLILDDQGNIIGNPFLKFFNIGEQSKEKICGAKLLKHKLGNFYIPDCDYKIYDKLDGSIIYVTLYSNELVIASKGSFESDQVLRARKIINNKYSHVKFLKGYTYIFEIIYPENRIVCDYGNEEDLYLLGLRLNGASKDVEFETLHGYAYESGFKTAKPFDKTIEECLDEINNSFDNREGYVVHFDDGNKLKIKFSSYMQLHKIMTDITSKDILESIEKGESIVDFCTDKNVPDEMIEEIKAVEKEFIEEYKKIEDDCKYFYTVAMDKRERKAQANNIKEFTPKKYQGIVFAMLDEKDYSKYIFQVMKLREKENRKYIGTCAK